MTKKTKPKPPKHLRAATRRWWEEIHASFELESHHSRLLSAICESWDRMQEARETVAKEGPYYRNKFNEPRPHPGLAVERDSKILFARLLREIRLDIPAPDDRPPDLYQRGR